jgi:hypothetical protein
MKSEGYKGFGLGNLIPAEFSWNAGKTNHRSSYGWRLIKRKEKPFNVK